MLKVLFSGCLSVRQQAIAEVTNLFILGGKKKEVNVFLDPPAIHHYNQQILVRFCSFSWFGVTLSCEPWYILGLCWSSWDGLKGIATIVAWWYLRSEKQIMFSNQKGESQCQEGSDDILPMIYCETSNISHTLVGNKFVDHSDVAGASPVGAAPTTSSFST